MDKVDQSEKQQKLRRTKTALAAVAKQSTKMVAILPAIATDAPPPASPVKAGADWPDADLEFMAPPTPPSPALPIDILPESLRNLALGFAEARKICPDFVVGALLGGCAGAIGNRVRLLGEDGDPESLSLYVIEIGKPSTSKTRALNCVQRPLFAIESAMQQAHLAITGGGGSPALQKIDREIREVVSRRLALEHHNLVEVEEREAMPGLIVTEFTGAGLIEELRKDATGRMVVHDEISGAFDYASANQGERTRTLLLRAYDGAPHTVTTKTDGTIRIPSVTLTILGATQPAKLDKLIDKARDGLVARIIWIYPEVEPTAAMPVGPGPVDELRQLLTRLISIDPAGGIGPDYSAVVTLAPDARDHIEAASLEWVERMCRTEGMFCDVLGRAAQHARRLAAIFAIVNHAASGRDGLPDKVELPEVESAVAFVARYVLPMAERALSATKTAEESDAVMLARHLRAMGKPIVNVRSDIVRCSKSGFLNRQVEAMTALEELRLRGILQRFIPQGKQGRPEVAYEVNPALLTRAPNAPTQAK